MDTIKIKHKHTQMIAHRGLSGLEKENTAASFIAAGNRSYFGCECDIHLTKDNKWVIVHDCNLKRVGEHDINVEDYTLDELYNFKLIDNFDNERKAYSQVVSMIDYVKICKKYNKKCIIEYKHDFNKEQVKDVLDIITSLEYLDNCIFISFCRDVLVITKELNPNLECQYLVCKFDEDVFEFCKANHLGLDALHTSLNKDIIKRYHELGLNVNAWTVNDPKIALNLIKAKIDFITTNILE